MRNNVGSLVSIIITRMVLRGVFTQIPEDTVRPGWAIMDGP
jgi:hypothetical protein